MVSQSVIGALKLARLLNTLGFTVSRHASSLLVMYNGRIVGSIHVYGGSCRVTVNLVAAGPWRTAALKLPQIAGNICETVEARVLDENSLETPSTPYSSPRREAMLRA